MRLIDADKLLEELNSFSMRITGNANAMALSVMNETKKSIVKMIEEQETAYDVDKALDRIEEIREEILNDTAYDNDTINHYLGYADLMIETVSR